MTDLPQHTIPCLSLQQSAMSRYSGEESLSRALSDSSSLVHTQVREAPRVERGGEGGRGEGEGREGGRRGRVIEIKEEGE